MSSALTDEVIQLRLKRENCNTGELHISLIWNDIADLDLHVIAPSGEELYYGHKESKCGGWLDKDMNVSCSTASLEPVENVFWASSPSGHYKVFVRNFNCHTRDDTVFTDRKRLVPFRVKMIRNGKTFWSSGEVGDHEDYTCFEFDHQGSGAIGSFVVLPPNTEPSTFEELCTKNNVTYTKGSGYYALTKAETVSAEKDMLLHDITSDTFIIGAEDCRKKLGFKVGDKISIKKKDIPENFRLFVQSTSANRKIPKDTHSLMRVSVKEALKHRLSNKYLFKD